MTILKVNRRSDSESLSGHIQSFFVIFLFLKNLFSQDVAGRDNTERRRRQILLDRFRFVGSQDSPGIKDNEIGILGRRRKTNKKRQKLNKKRQIEEQKGRQKERQKERQK